MCIRLHPFTELQRKSVRNKTCFTKPYITPQDVEQITQQAVEQKGKTIIPQLGEQIRNDIFSKGWGQTKCKMTRLYPQVW